jgi:hypothetical protein
MRLRHPGEPLAASVARRMDKAPPKNRGPRPCVHCGEPVKWSMKMKCWAGRDKAGRFGVTFCRIPFDGRHKVR